MFDDTRGTVSTRNPADDVTITITSGTPPTAIVLTISTPCYQFPPETPSRP
jgi:hypothetical protein